MVLTLNKRNSGRETMVRTIVIVGGMIPENQISMFPVFLAIVLPPQFLWFKIQWFQILCPFNFYRQFSWEIPVLCYSMHSWHENIPISYNIEWRFYQEVYHVTSSGINKAWQALADFAHWKTLYLHQTLRYLNWHPNLDTQTSGE